MAWCSHGGIAYFHMINETLSHKISSIFHFDRVSDGGMAHVLGVKWCPQNDFFLDSLVKYWQTKEKIQMFSYLRHVLVKFHSRVGKISKFLTQQKGQANF